MIEKDKRMKEKERRMAERMFASNDDGGNGNSGKVSRKLMAVI